MLKALPAILLILSAPALAASQGRDVEETARSMLLGEFVDDYGIRYLVTTDEWRQGDEARYQISEWNVRERYLIARNGPGNATEPGLWTRIDWVQLEPGSEYEWAFCYTVYNAESSTEARSAPASQRSSPRDGCNGYPFSRMRRTAKSGGS